MMIGSCRRHGRVTRNSPDNLCDVCFLEICGLPTWAAHALDLLVPMGVVVAMILFVGWFVSNVLAAIGG